MNARIVAASLIASAVLAITPTPALADGPEATSMRIAVPPAVGLGAPAQVQAQLVDAAGKPIAGAIVLFRAPISFLASSGDVILADATTDKAGIADAEVDLRTEGTVEISAVFAGDAQHAASSAKATIEVRGSGQLYAEGAGVKVPGLNEAPTAPGASAALLPGLSSLWPRLSGWPIALVLMIVWSLYASVVVVLFRITAASRRASA